MTNNPFKFTFILGYRHRPDRVQNLRRVLDWINGFAGVEVIVVEQDSKRRIDDLNLKITNHVFVKSNKPFNKSWAFNVGSKYATTDILVFSDSDLIVSPDTFINALNMLKDHEYVNPYSKVIDLDPNESSLNLNSIIQIDRPGRGNTSATDIEKVPMCGGMNMYRKDAYFKIGGFSEGYWSWGAEDSDASIKTSKFLSCKEMEATCYHLWHQRDAPDQESYMRNLQLYNQVLNLDDKALVRYVESNKIKMGSRNSYQ